MDKIIEKLKNLKQHHIIKPLYFYLTREIRGEVVFYINPMRY